VRGESRLVDAFETEAREGVERVADAQGLGGACRTTADCKAGLGCANAAYSGVNTPHIAGGYCSRWCETSTDCERLEVGSYCSVNHWDSALNFCLAPCVTGAGDGAAKCGGRDDVQCGFLPAPGVDTYCSPRCTGDADCQTGRCNAYNGLCDTTLEDRPVRVGPACSESNPSACNGNCVLAWPDSDRGLCIGYCRLGSTCGQGPGTVCAPAEFGLREGDGGRCERVCSTSADCVAGYTACSPTGFITPSGESQRGCAQIYDAPASLAPQRLSVEQLTNAALPLFPIAVSTTSIFQALSHRLDVQEGAVCVTGETSASGGVLYLDFQFQPNNGSALDASQFSGVVFDTTGAHVVRLDVFASGREYSYLTPDRRDAGDVGEGPQVIGFEQFFDIFAGDAPLLAGAAAELAALRFSVVLDGSGPFRFCVDDLDLQPGTPPADDDSAL
jgi:hypothetical protein